MYRWFQFYLSNFDTGVDNALIPHLAEPAPYMGQVLSPISTHSVSCGALHIIAGCHPEGLWRIERKFHPPSSSTIYKMLATYGPSNRFSELFMYFGLF